jgi:transposase
MEPTSKETKVDYAAWIGVDWGSEKHAIVMQAANSSGVEQCVIKQTPEALQDWFLKVRSRFPGREVAIAIEQSKGSVINFLLGFDLVHVFRVNPKSLKKYREALFPSGAKDDPTDAELLLQFVRYHRDRMKPWVPDDPQSRALLALVEFRRKTVAERTRLTNRLTQKLKEYFPQALEWTGDLDTVMACDFLTRWPTIEKLQKTRPENIRKFYQKHGSRNSHRIDERLRQIRSAIPLTQDSAVMDTSVLMVETIVNQLRPLFVSIRRIDGQVEKIFRMHPDFGIFDSFPGAGAALAPRLQTAMGSDRDRFDSSEEVQKYSGIAPVLERSGKKHWVHRRYACSTFIRQSFHEFAGHSIKQCQWARAYYTMQRDLGKGHHAAVRALAYKWIRIIFRCWKNHVPYDDATYMESLRRKRASCLAFVDAAA